jgi:hypothetical protein
VLAAVLVMAASTGCSDDGSDSGEVGGTTAPAAATTDTGGPTTTPPTTETSPEATTADATTAQATTAQETTEETDTTGRPEPPSDQSRWAAQVDDVCKPWQEKIDAVPPPTDVSSLEAWLGDTLPLVRKQVAAVKAVKPPAKAEEARRARLFIGALQKIERALTRYHAAIVANNAQAVQKWLSQANAAGAEARGYAASLDVTQCGGYRGG